MARSCKASKPSADDDDIWLRWLGGNPFLDGRGDAKVDVTIGEEEVEGRVEEGFAVGRDGGGNGVFEEVLGDIIAPAGEDVVADKDVVNLLNAADCGDDAELNLFIGEGVGGEAGGEAGECFAGGFTVDDDDLLGEVGVGGEGSRRRGERERERWLAADAGALALAAGEWDVDMEIRVRVRVWEWRKLMVLHGLEW